MLVTTLLTEDEQEKAELMFFGRTYKDTSAFERNYHQLRISASQNINSITDSVLHDMSVLDSKSAALLQFISVVLAALTFALGLVDATAVYAHYIRAGIILYIACFGSAAWIDLRCLYAMSTSNFVMRESVPDYEATLMSEIAKRRQNYERALHIAQTSFILLMPFLLLWLLLATRMSSMFS